MCATWTKEPEVGADIIDLSILPFLLAFFFFSDALLAREGVESWHEKIVSFLIRWQWTHISPVCLIPS
jgi:hypothetical protein